MRKSIDGLASLVENELELSPMQNALFGFCNRGRDNIKLLYWERNGSVVCYKRLEKQHFRWPSQSEIDVVIRDGRSLNYLLDDFGIWQKNRTNSCPSATSTEPTAV